MENSVGIRIQDFCGTNNNHPRSNVSFELLLLNKRKKSHCSNRDDDDLEIQHSPKNKKKQAVVAEASEPFFKHSSFAHPPTPPTPALLEDDAAAIDLTCNEEMTKEWPPPGQPTCPSNKQLAYSPSPPDASAAAEVPSKQDREQQAMREHIKRVSLLFSILRTPPSKGALLGMLKDFEGKSKLPGISIPLKTHFQTLCNLVRAQLQKLYGGCGGNQRTVTKDASPPRHQSEVPSQQQVVVASTTTPNNNKRQSAEEEEGKGKKKCAREKRLIDLVESFDMTPSFEELMLPVNWDCSNSSSSSMEDEEKKSRGNYMPVFPAGRLRTITGLSDEDISKHAERYQMHLGRLLKHPEQLLGPYPATSNEGDGEPESDDEEYYQGRLFRSPIFKYPREFLVDDDQIELLHWCLDLIHQGCAELNRDTNLRIDVQTLELALNICHNLILSIPYSCHREEQPLADFVFSNACAALSTSKVPMPYCNPGRARYTAGGCISIAIKFFQSHDAPFREIESWIGSSPVFSMQKLELQILNAINWNIVPLSCSTTALLTMTGLLKSHPRECLDTLNHAIVCSYHRFTLESPRDAKLPMMQRYAVLYQARAMDPACVALACYHAMLLNCASKDVVKAANALAQGCKDLELTLLLEEGVQQLAFLTSEWFETAWLDRVISRMVACMRGRLCTLVSSCTSSQQCSPPVSTRGAPPFVLEESRFYQDVLLFINELLAD